MFACLALAFIANYDVLPRFDHRYRAVFFPGGDARAATSRAAGTTRPACRFNYVIGTMWDGGNVAHYSPDQPRVLVDGKPARAPWIDLYDLKKRGAVVVWTEGDLKTVPPEYRALAPNAQVQPPLQLHYRHGSNAMYAGWAIVPPAK